MIASYHETNTVSLFSKHVVFGRVISGEEIVVEIEELPVDNKKRPLSTVRIEKCGQLVARAKPKGMPQ